MSTASPIAALLLWSSLWLAAPAAPLELTARRSEAALLHRTIDLGGLRRFDPQHNTWTLRPPAPAAVIVLHLWAVECPPCLAEMPLWRDITRGFHHSVRQVRFVYASETLDTARLLEFVRRHAGTLPAEPLYQSTDDRIRRALQNQTLPLTLLLDEQLRVRQAFIGSIHARRNELVEGIERLLASHRSRQ